MFFSSCHRHVTKRNFLVLRAKLMSDHQILDFDAQPFSHMDSPMRTVVTGFKDNTPTVYCNARSLV